MDIKEKIEQTVKKLMENPKLLQKFEKEPVKVIEELIGVDLPDYLVNQLIDGIKAKIAVEKAGDVLQGLGKLFGK